MGGSSNPLSGVPVIGDMMNAGRGQDMAEMQGKVAMEQLYQQTNDRAQAAQYAKPTDLQMQQLNQAVQTNTDDITRKQQLLASADPAFLEAGRQALQLMKGGDSAAAAQVMQPLQQQRDAQRAQLTSRLQSQLGPGWENSTAGQQAMQAFDAQSASTMNNARMNTLSGLMGYAGQAEQNGNVNSNIQNSQNIIGTQGQMQNRQIQAIMGTPITNAGAEYAGQINSNQAAMNASKGMAGGLGALYNYAGGSGGLGADVSKLGGMFGGGAAGGGMLDAGGTYLSAGGGEALGSGAAAGVMLAAKGGRVPGRAAVPGDSYANDKVPALLSPGEIVLPRHIVAKGPKAMAAFAKKAANAKR